MFVSEEELLHFRAGIISFCNMSLLRQITCLVTDGTAVMGTLKVSIFNQSLCLICVQSGG